MIIEKTIGNRVAAKVEIEGLDIPEMGVLGYINEDTREVQLAGEDFISTHGPGVPSKVTPEPATRFPLAVLDLTARFEPPAVPACRDWPVVFPTR